MKSRDYFLSIFSLAGLGCSLSHGVTFDENVVVNAPYTLEVKGDALVIGLTGGTSRGFSLDYLDGTTSEIQFNAYNSQNKWIWMSGDSQTAFKQMELGADGALSLFDANVSGNQLLFSPSSSLITFQKGTSTVELGLNASGTNLIVADSVGSHEFWHAGNLSTSIVTSIDDKLDTTTGGSIDGDVHIEGVLTLNNVGSSSAFTVSGGYSGQPLAVFQRTDHPTGNGSLSILAPGGDPQIRFDTVSPSSTIWGIGVDDSDYDSFKIGVGSISNANPKLVIETDGDVVVDGELSAQAINVEGARLQFQVASRVELEAFDTSSLDDGAVIYMSAYAEEGDGGAGHFRWDSSSDETANGGTVFEAQGSNDGRWHRIFPKKGTIDVRWFGASGDYDVDGGTGGDNDNEAFKSAVAAMEESDSGISTLFIPPGSYKLTETLKISKDSKHLAGKGGVTLYGVDSGFSSVLISYSAVPGQPTETFKPTVWISSRNSSLEGININNENRTAQTTQDTCLLVWLENQTSSTWGRFQLKNVVVSNSGGFGFVMSHGEHTKMENLWAPDNHVGIYCAEISWSTWINCRVQRSDSYGWHFDHHCSYSVLISPESLHNGDFQMRFIRCNGFHLFNLDIEAQLIDRKLRKGIGMYLCDDFDFNGGHYSGVVGFPFAHLDNNAAIFSITDSERINIDKPRIIDANSLSSPPILWQTTLTGLSVGDYVRTLENTYQITDLNNSDGNLNSNSIAPTHIKGKATPDGADGIEYKFVGEKYPSFLWSNDLENLLPGDYVRTDENVYQIASIGSTGGHLDANSIAPTHTSGTVAPDGAGGIEYTFISPHYYPVGLRGFESTDILINIPTLLETNGKFASEQFVKSSDQVPPDPSDLLEVYQATNSVLSNEAAWNEAYSWGNHNDEPYLTGEVDPIFDGSPAKGISGSQIINWDEAYSWGNHNDESYLTGEVDPIFNGSPAKGISGSQIINWDEAHSWGDHNLKGYAVAGNLVDNSIPVWDLGNQTLNAGVMSQSGQSVLIGVGPTEGKLRVDQDDPDTALHVNGGNGGNPLAVFQRDHGSVGGKITIAVPGTNPQIKMDPEGGGTSWSVGVDDADNDNIKIGVGSVGSDTKLSISPSGHVTTAGRINNTNLNATQTLIPGESYVVVSNVPNRSVWVVSAMADALNAYSSGFLMKGAGTHSVYNDGGSQGLTFTVNSNNDLVVTNIDVVSRSITITALRIQ